MKLTEAFTKLLREHERIGRHPEVFLDSAFKLNYYGLYNYVFDALDKIDKEKTTK